MSTNIEALKVYASVAVDLSDLRKGIKDADVELSKVGANAKANGLDKFVGDISSKLKSVGAGLTMAGAGITAAFTAPVGYAVKAASDLSESLNKVNVVFGDSSGKIQEFAKSSATSLGISQQNALEAAGTFGNLFTAMKIGKPAAADMSISLTKLAADLGSFNNLDPTAVLEKLRAGITGEAEPLKSLGIIINETAVKAKAMELGFKAVGGQLTEQQKVAARYTLIMEQSATAQGDFANTSTGLANATRIAKAQLETLAANLGSAFLPYVNQAVAFVNNLLVQFQQLPEPVQKAITVVAGIGAVLGPVLVVLGSIVSAVGAVLPVLTSLGSALTVLTGPIGIAIAAVVALAIAYKTNFAGIRDGVNEIASQLKLILDRIISFVKAHAEDFKQIWEGLKAVVVGVVNFIGFTLSGLVDVIRAILRAINGDWQGAWELLKSAGQKFATAIVQLVAGIFNGLVSILAGIWGLIRNGVVSAWNGIANFFTTTVPNMLLGFIEWWASLPVKLVGFLLELPVKVGSIFGQLAGTAIRLAGELFVGVVGFFQNLPSTLASLATSAWALVTSAFNAGVQFAIQAATTLYNGVSEWIGRLPELFTSIWTSIVNYISGIPGLLWEKARSLGSAIWEGFKDGLGIHSPSFIEVAVTRAVVNIQGELSKGADTAAAPAQRFGKSIHQNFAAGFSGLDKEVDRVIGLMASVPEKVEKVVAPAFKKAAQGIKESFKEILDAVNEFQDALGTGVKLTERELLDLVKTFGRALPDAALAYKRTTEELQKEVIRLNEVFRKSNQDLKAVFRDGRIVIEQGGKEFVEELEKNKRAVGIAARLNDVFARENRQLVATLDERNRIVIRSTEKLRSETSLVAEKLSDDLSKRLGADLAKELAVEGEKVRESYLGVWRKVAEEAGLTASQSVDFIIAELKKLPAEIQGVVRPGVDAYISELQRAGKFTEEQTARMGGSFSDFMSKLRDVLGNGMANLVAFVLQALGSLNTETLKRFGEVSEGVVQVIGALPGKVGDKLRGVTSAVLDWVNRIDSILAGLNKIWNKIPANIGELAEKIISIFKKTNKQVLDTAKTTQDEIQKAAKNASKETDGLAANAEQGSSRISKAFAVATAAVGAFVSGLATANATGSKAIGSLVGGLQGALSGFAAGGPIGAVIGGIGGVLGGLFGGKSAAQKQQEKLQLERLKQDVQKGAQEVMQAAFETVEKALNAFEHLADFTRTPNKIIHRFFAQMKTVIRDFIALAKVWSVQMLDAARRFAESVWPIIEVIGSGVEAFEKLSFFTGVPEKAITLFGSALDRAVALFVELSDNFQNKAERQAKKFAKRAREVVATIGEGVQAFVSLQDYKGITVEVFDLFKRDLEYALNKMLEVADDIDRRLLKQAAKFSERALAVVAVIKEGVDAFKGINEYQAIKTEIFDAFLADLKLALEKMQQVVREIDTEMMSMASAFAQKSLAIFAAIKAGVEAFAALRDYKALPAEVLDQFLADFKVAIELLKETLTLALEGESLAEKFKNSAVKIAEYLAKAGEALAGVGGSAAESAKTALAAGAAATIVAASTVGGTASQSLAAPNNLSSQSASIRHGNSTTHITEGPIYLQVDASKLQEVEALVRIIEQARQRRRARKVV